METLQFSVNINAPKSKVWKTLWDDITYRKWTTPFCEGSHAVTDWNEGSKVLFLGPDGSGMVSTVASNKPNDYMSIKHIGVVQKGVEDTDSEQSKAFAGAMENYTLVEEGNTTELKIEMDSFDGYKDYLLKTWPKALEQVKALSENNL